MAPGSEKKEKKCEDSPVDNITDDILADIISRVPYKSTCCCKCVSTRWRDLFSHPDHRKKLPQPLAGFFYTDYNRDRFPKIARYFTNVSGQGEPLVDPSMSFLPTHSLLDILDCCNGLLLCRCWYFTETKLLDYVVCNPATEKWVVVPATDWSSKVEVARLGFEPTVSSHFYVFEFIDEHAWCIDESELDDCGGCIEAVTTYSSKTGVWRQQMIEHNQFEIPRHSKGVFFNSIMHLAASDDIVVTFDVERSLLWIIGTPASPRCCDDSPLNDVFVSQGQLFFASSTGSDHSKLSVWVLQDYGLSKWTLKHTISHLQLFGATSSAVDYSIIAFHPEHNMIFIVYGHENTLLSYDMDCRKRSFLCQLGRRIEYFGIDVKTPFIPYVPLFAESLADGTSKVPVA